MFDASSDASKPSKPVLAGIPAASWVRRYYQWRLDGALSGRGAEPPDLPYYQWRLNKALSGRGIEPPDVPGAAAPAPTDDEVDGFDVARFMALLKRESVADAAIANFPLAERRPVPAWRPASARPVPAYKARRRRSVPLDDLLGLDGADFVRNAYVAVLAREADRSGLANYLKQLNGTRTAKISVLHSLVNSEEGRRRGTRVPGLTFWTLYYRVKEQPLSTLPRRTLRRLLLALRPAPADSR